MISFTNVSKRYRGWAGREVHALTSFTLDTREGEVLGIAGPNGAGKSTLIALMLGFLSPSEGDVRIAEMDPRRYVETHGVAYLSELINIPPAWRLGEALERYALLSGVPQSRLKDRIREAIAMLGLEEHRGKRVRQLSKGNLQRLGLAQALLCEQQVVVLDEPTHGLDPVWTQRFRDIVVNLRRPGRTIIIASHNLDELARLADRVAIMDHGKLQRVVDVRAVEHAHVEGEPYRLVIASGAELVSLHVPLAREVGRGEFVISGATLEEINRDVAALIGAGALVSSLVPVHSALEQQFRDVVGTSMEGRE